jgi:hypothetical protein
MDSKKLEEIHDALTETLLKKIRNGEATAADLSVARQFLKDNGIEVTNPRSNTSPMGQLAALVPFKDDEEATG